MSDRDFYNLREMIRKMQRRIDQLEKALQEKSVTT
jgi:DNA-binding protein YbaB